MPDVKEMAKPRSNGPQAEAKGGTALAERDERRAGRLARRTSLAAAAAGSPFAFIRHFAEELDRLVDDFSVGHAFHVPSFVSRGHEMLRRESGMVEADWSPRVDVLEHDGKIVVRADLPGLSKDDIKVEVSDDMITVEGERKQEAKDERKGYVCSEPSYGRFYRSIALPQGADTSKATAEFHGGVLEVAVPAPPAGRPAKSLEIREKK